MTAIGIAALVVLIIVIVEVLLGLIEQGQRAVEPVPVRVERTERR